MDKKIRGRRRLFKCFKPAGVDDDDYRFDCYLSSPSLHSDDHERSATRKPLGRSFSGSLKAALSKSSLVRRFRGKKARKDSPRSIHSTDQSPSRCENVDDIIQTDSGDFSRTSSAPSSIFSSSPSTLMTSSSSSSSSSLSNSLNLKQMSLPCRKLTFTRRKSGKYGVCTRPGIMRGGMVSFMVCLACVVLCGKVFAILACTSTWLYFAPTGRHISDLDSVINSYEYKNKVILQGLLERNRSRYVGK